MDGFSGRIGAGDVGLKESAMSVNPIALQFMHNASEEEPELVGASRFENAGASALRRDAEGPKVMPVVHRDQGARAHGH